MSDWEDAPTAVAPAKSSGGWEDAPAKPAASDSGTLRNIVGAYTEPVAAMASGMVAKPVSEIAGLAAILSDIVSGKKGDPQGFQASVQDALTYQPTTPAGKAITEYNPMALAGKAIDWAGGKAESGIGAIPLPEPVRPYQEAYGRAIHEGINQSVALLGARGGAALKAKPRTLPVPATDAAIAMTERGTSLTPGQMLGGGWDRAEQALSKWPMIGGPIRAARARAFEDFNRAAYDDVLAPVKETLPEDLKGHDAAKYVNDKLGARYEDYLGKAHGSLDGEAVPVETRASSGTGLAVPGTGIGAPGQAAKPFAPTESLRSDLQNLSDLVEQSKLPDSMKGEFSRIVNEDIIARFEKNGKADGQTIKDIETNLRVLAQKKRLSDNRDVNAVGLAVNEARSALRRMVERENPEIVGDIRATDAAWARFKIAQKATVSAGKEGIFTPAQLERAVKSQDKTKDKRAYSEGDANMQQFTKDARQAIGEAIPDSGTPFQAFMAALAGGGKGLLGIPGGIAGSAALALPYSKTGVSLIQSALSNASGIGKGTAVPDIVRALGVGTSEEAGKAKVTTKAQFDALPVGTEFVDARDGKIKVKE